MKKTITSAAVLLACSATIAITAPTVHAASGQWQQNAKGWWYQRSDKTYPKNKWEEINGRWFYFDDQGYMLKNRWVGDYYVGYDGAMIKGAGTPDGYYVDEEGKWAKGWKLDHKGWWYERSDKTYPRGKWEEIEGVWYYFNDEGYMVYNKWIQDYYVGSNGAMLRNALTPDNYVVGPDGHWVKGVNQNRAQEVIQFLKEIQMPTSKYSKEAFLRILTDRGYTRAEAEATVESLGVDWIQHAAEAYKTNEIGLEFYLASKPTVVKKLTSEDYRFTENELEEAFLRLGVDWVANARNLAKKYLAEAKEEGYSREGLVKKLVKASFTEDEATKAVDGLHIDWSEQELKQ